MDPEAARIAELVTEACGLVERAEHVRELDADLVTALDLVRRDLLGAAFSTYVVDAANDAFGAVAELDRALGMLERLPEAVHVSARAS